MSTLDPIIDPSCKKDHLRFGVGIHLRQVQKTAIESLSAWLKANGDMLVAHDTLF